MAKKHPNILLLGIDSIRRDHMSCYGYSRLTTPYMDRIAAGGALFENAFSPYIPTTPAYVSMISGRDVISTQMPSLQALNPMEVDQPTLPEILKKVGYKSVCVGHGDFYRGFDEYIQYASWGNPDESAYSPKAEKLNEVALPALEKLHESGEPWLLFLRHMDPHTPYMPPPPFNNLFYTKDCASKDLPNTMQAVWDFKPFADYFESWLPEGIRDSDYVVAAYDGAVAYMDACIQRLFTRLEELGVMDDTLIVITGDHGETLYDHGCWFDHHGLYEPTLVVPLVFYWRGHIPAGVRTQSYTLHEDLVPTILDICGVEKAAKDIPFDGISNVPYFTDTKSTYRSEFYIEECTWMRKQGWRTPIWKFWEALEPDFHGKPALELYNLLEDPQELNNLADKEQAVVAALRCRMNDWLQKRTAETGKPNPIHKFWIGTEKHIGSVRAAQKLQAK